MKALIEASYKTFIGVRVDFIGLIDLLFAPFEKNLLKYQMSLNILNVAIGIMIGSLLYKLAVHFSFGTIFTIAISVIVVALAVFHQIFTAELIRQNLQYNNTIEEKLDGVDSEVDETNVDSK